MEHATQNNNDKLLCSMSNHLRKSWILQEAEIKNVTKDIQEDRKNSKLQNITHTIVINSC